MNQEQNGLNGSNVGINVNPTPVPNPEPNQNNQPEVGNVSSPIENVEVVKPSLDSILNGNETNEAKTVDALETSPANVQPSAPEVVSAPVADVSPQPVETVNTAINVEAPTMETISAPQTPVEPTPVVTPTMETINPVGTSTPEPALNANPVPPTPSIEEPVSTNLNPEPVVAPKVETIETPEVTPNVEVVAPTIETINTPQAPIEPSPVGAPTIETMDQTSAVTPEPVASTPETPVTTPNPEPSVPSTEVPTNTEAKVETPTDDFNAVPVPPVLENDGKKKKKGGNKLLIVLLLVVLVALVGFGVYTALSLAKKTTTTAKSITTKELKLELGSMLSREIEDYATISGYNKEECSLDLNNINMEKVSTYKFSVTCDKETKEGLVIVDDSTKPEVVTQDLILVPNSQVNPEDFIEECIDASLCTYEFESPIDTSTVGEQTVTIIVSDEYNNKNTVSAKLTISTNAPSRYLMCTKGNETISDINATLVDSYKIGIDASENFYNATRISEFRFASQVDYNTVVNNYVETEGIHEIVGTATYDANSFKVTLKADKTLEDMQKELNGNLPQNSNILRAFLSGLGYICQ